jgi:2-aminoadipate transaminase
MTQPNTDEEIGIVQEGSSSDIFDLSPGYLDPGLMPGELIGRWSSAAVDRWGSKTLAYGAQGGPQPLRAALTDRLLRTASTPHITDENIVTTAGTSAMIEELAMRFSREGRVVLTESLSYDLAIGIFRGWGVDVHGVAGPSEDLDVDGFRRASVQAIRTSGLAPAYYIIPTFHNPTGRTLSVDRRGELLSLADEMNSLIIEDQAYAGLSFEDVPPPPIWAMAEDPESVVSLYTASKFLAPGLRLGWIVAGQRLARDLEESPVRLSGGGPSHYASMLLYSGIASGELDTHINSLRSELKNRRDSLLRVLNGLLPKGFRASQPDGGYFTWVTTPQGVSEGILLEEARALGVNFALGSRFGEHAQGVRICFSRYSPGRLEEAGSRFAQACETVSMPR